MFSGKPIPSVGFSFGIERLFVILENLHKDAAWLRGPATHVLVATIGKGLALERLKLASELWKAGINAEILHEENPKPQKFISHALDNMVPFIIWLGNDEIENGNAKVKVRYLHFLSMFNHPSAPTRMKNRWLREPQLLIPLRS